MKTDPIRRAFQNNRCELIATLYLFFSYIVMVFNSVVRTFISNTHKLDTAFLYGLLLVGILLSVRQLFSRIAFWQIMSVMLLGSALVLGILFSRSQNVNFSVAQKIATTCLPAFFLLGVVRDYSAFKRFLTTAAEATPYLVACVFLFLKFGQLGDNSYDQATSYYLLLPAIILIGDLTGRFRIRSFIPLPPYLLILMKEPLILIQKR